MKKYLLTALLGGIIFQGCTSKKVQVTPETAATETTEGQEGQEEEMETIDLSQLEIFGKKDQGPYRGSEKRVNDLLHTKLEVGFDWEKRHVIGKATLDFTPYFYPTKILTLDAKGFDLNEVALLKYGKKTELKHKYDGAFIEIELDKEYKAGDKYTIFIDYVAKPEELDAGGSAAITEDKGLYFINPDGTKDIPQQIWTQGETEASSCWFPTIDSPNERTTQDMYITVQDKFVSLSNGKFLNSKKNADGTRTDHWEQKKDHPPYLFMLAVGDFAVIKDQWKGKPVHYYVEHEFEPYAKKVFGNTPEMLEFYSNVLDYPFPWDKYHQIVVREFVSGAMENTSAVVFFDGLNRDFRELLDEDHEDIVAHELFHHWFGDIVTCESWANLPLNESFATYGEYLWMEHKYGKDAADFHILKDLRNYLSEAQEEKKDLIRFHYDDKEDMFDRHSYEKGGRVLHMLRNYVGDEAFFKSLSLYLHDNEFQPVEIHQLRLAFEEVTGEDLNWFFNQWFLNSGHPILEITYDFDDELGKSVVTIKQTQTEDVFELPMAIDLYNGKEVTRENVIMNEREQIFTFDVSSKPDLINVDADKMLLCQKTDRKSLEQMAFQLDNAPNLLDRYEVALAIGESNDSTIAASLTAEDKTLIEDLAVKLLNDKFWSVRGRTAQELNLKDNPSLQARIVPILKKMATNDKKSTARFLALEALSTLEDKSMSSLYSKALKDSSYTVIGGALSGLSKVDKEGALKEASKMEKEDKGDITRAISSVYGEHGGKEQLAFFETNIKEKEGFTRYMLFENYGKVLGNLGKDTDLGKGIGILKDGALNDKTWWVRLSGARALNNLRGTLKETEGNEEVVKNIVTALKEIKEKEDHNRLKMLYQMQMIDLDE